MRRLSLALPLASSLLATACTVGPDYRRPAIMGEAAGWSGPANVAAAAADPWAPLGDAMLTQLIAAALAHNPDIAEAEAGLRAARATRDVAAGGRLPAARTEASAQQVRMSENGQLPLAKLPGFDRNFALFDAGFDASWEIDLWGGTRRRIEAAGRETDAAAAEAAGTRLRIAAEVVKDYADLRGAQAALAIARAEAETRSRFADLTRQRAQAGEASRIDLAQADAQARASAAAVPGAEADVRGAAAALAALTGQPPEALAGLVAVPVPLPMPPANVAVGLRSDVLRRRPDVRAAEAELAAATATIGVETARLFPTLTLIGGVTQEARRPGDLLSATSTGLQLGPSLQWPVFDAGRIRAQVRAAGARADQAAARYAKAVLGALADSETALNRYSASMGEADARAAALDASKAALDLAQQAYRSGESDRLAALEAQSAYDGAAQADIAARQRALIDYGALVKALGGAQ